MKGGFKMVLETVLGGQSMNMETIMKEIGKMAKNTVSVFKSIMISRLMNNIN